MYFSVTLGDKVLIQDTLSQSWHTYPRSSPKSIWIAYICSHSTSPFMQENKGYLYSIWGYQTNSIPFSVSIKKLVIQMSSIRIHDFDDGLPPGWIYILKLLPPLRWNCLCPKLWNYLLRLVWQLQNILIDTDYLTLLGCLSKGTGMVSRPTIPRGSSSWNW